MRVLAGAIIFLVLVGVFGYWSQTILSDQAEDLSVHLDRMAKYVEKQDWAAARKELAALEKQWVSVQPYWDIIIEHHEMDNIDSALVKISEYLSTRTKDLVLGEISTARHYLKHIPEKELFTTQNIL